MDQDPLGALDGLDADPVRRADRRPDRRPDRADRRRAGTALAAAERTRAIILDPVGFVLGAGIGLGQLTICVLGVLLITTEYSTGVIRASLLAVPKRLPMLIAKITVFAVMMVVLAEIVAFGCFFVGTLLLHSKVAVSISDPGVIRAVVGAGLYLAVLGLFSLGIGLLIRHTAGAIATAIGVVFVLPILTRFLPGSWGEHVNAYLPEQAGIGGVRGARERRSAAVGVAGLRRVLPVDGGAARRRRLPAAAAGCLAPDAWLADQTQVASGWIAPGPLALSSG